MADDSIEYVDESNTIHNIALKCVYKEYESLKSELQGYKDCQLTFLTFTITGTAAILGLAKYVNDSQITIQHPLMNGLVYLLPLLIILPSWFIFFNKAGSVSRTVGNIRMVEKILYNKEKFTQNKYLLKRFDGHELMLDKYREYKAILGKYDQPTLDKIKSYYGSKFFRNLYRKTHFQYWSAIYVIFLILSALCIFLYIVNTPYDIPSGNISIFGLWYLPINTLEIELFFSILTLWIAYITLKKLYHISIGDKSYKKQERFWDFIAFRQPADNTNLIKIYEELEKVGFEPDYHIGLFLWKTTTDLIEDELDLIEKKIPIKKVYLFMSVVNNQKIPCVCEIEHKSNRDIVLLSINGKKFPK